MSHNRSQNNVPATVIAQSAENDLEYIISKVFLQGEELFITNCYNPPTSRLYIHITYLQRKKHPTVEDFNGRSPAWGYDDSDSRGDEIQNWLIDKELVLFNEPRDTPPYGPRAWKKTSTSDLAMTTGDVQKCDIRGVMGQLGGSDFDPVTIYILHAKTNNQYFR